MNIKKTDTKQTAPASTPVITDDDLLAPGVTDTDESAQTGEVSSVPEVNAPAQPAVPAAGVFMTATDIAEIVRSAVAAATSAVAGAGNQSIADSISKALTQHMGPRRLTVAELGEPKTPFNPTGAKRELKKEFFHNFAPIAERYVSDEEIERLHQLTPGHYGTEDFPIAVVEKKRLNGKARMFIIHPDSKDDRMRAKNYAQSFAILLQKLIQEAKDQRAQRRAEALALLEETT